MVPLDDNVLAGLTDVLGREFETAAAGTHEQRFLSSVAGVGFQLLIASKTLQELIRPLLHLQIPDPPRVIDEISHWQMMVWSTPKAAPPLKLPWEERAQSYLGSISGMKSQRFRVNYHPPARLLCLMDVGKRCAYFRLGDEEALPYWERAAPFRVLFHWLVQLQGHHLAHAAAVGRGGRGILIAGRGGVGKSSLTLACLDRGLSCLGDDYLVLGQGPVAFTLYNTAKLHTDFLKTRFSHLAGKVAMEIGPEHKSVFLLSEWKPCPLVSCLAIRALVIPRITQDPQPSVERASAPIALLALAPSTIFQLPESSRTSLAFFRQWTEGVPAYVLRTGSDPRAAAGLVDSLLDSLKVKSDTLEARSIGSSEGGS